MKPRSKRILWIAPLALLGMLLFVFVGGEVVKYLWNWLLPPLFHWPQITFWQGLGLLVLCRILFGGFHGHGGGVGWRARRRMQERTIERWESMTPEERDRFRQRMHSRCDFGPATGENREP